MKGMIIMASYKEAYQLCEELLTRDNHALRLFIDEYYNEGLIETAYQMALDEGLKDINPASVRFEWHVEPKRDIESIANELAEAYPEKSLHPDVVMNYAMEYNALDFEVELLQDEHFHYLNLDNQRHVVNVISDLMQDPRAFARNYYDDVIDTIVDTFAELGLPKSLAYDDANYTPYFSISSSDMEHYTINRIDNNVENPNTDMPSDNEIRDFVADYLTRHNGFNIDVKTVDMDDIEAREDEVQDFISQLNVTFQDLDLSDSDILSYVKTHYLYELMQARKDVLREEAPDSDIDSLAKDSSLFKIDIIPPTNNAYINTIARHVAKDDLYTDETSLLGNGSVQSIALDECIYFNSNDATHISVNISFIGDIEDLDL